ncbi:MAG: hypothetical protein KJ825_17840, partial [Alphaproteobacteria bacterium]|nr:hypothetical protein [Alphaproteobacteria bacterium]
RHILICQPLQVQHDAYPLTRRVLVPCMEAEFHAVTLACSRSFGDLASPFSNEPYLLEVVRNESEFRDIRLDAEMEADLRQLMRKWRDWFDRKMLGGSSGAEGRT